MIAVNEPESWWGWHGYDQPELMSIDQLIRAGTLSPRLAAMFWLGIERGANFVFAAEPPGAGKTAILTSLLPMAKDEAVAYFTQGWGEQFDVPPLGDSVPTYLLVNEMSDDLPVYSWGPYITRIFELMADGYFMATTMHAESVSDVIEILRADNVVPAEQVALLTFVAPIALVPHDDDFLRRISEVAMLELSGDEAVPRQLARWDTVTDTFAVLEDMPARETLAARLGLGPDALMEEIAAREAVLARLASENED